MKKMINIRNGVIIILCVTLILMGIGFIVVSMELKKYRDSEDKFSVVFIDPKKVSSVKGSMNEPVGNVEVVSSGKVMNMSFYLTAVHDELTYSVTIRNNGTIPAKIIDVYASPDYTDDTYKKNINPVSITTTDVEGKVLEPKEELEYKITVYYNPTTSKVVPKGFKYNLALITESN